MKRLENKIKSRSKNDMCTLTHMHSMYLNLKRLFLCCLEVRVSNLILRIGLTTLENVGTVHPIVMKLNIIGFKQLKCYSCSKKGLSYVNRFWVHIVE